MKKVISVIQKIAIVLLVLLLLFNLWMLFSKLVLQESLPKFFGFSQASVLSGSMAPEFFAGDMLVFSEKSEYSVGDVVIFSDGNAFVTHRIVEETSDGFITRGDANNINDKGTITTSDIKGKMALVIPRAGAVFGFMKTPVGLFILAFIGILLIGLPNIIFGKKEGAGADE